MLLDRKDFTFGPLSYNRYIGLGLYRRSLYRGSVPTHFTVTFAGTYLNIYHYIEDLYIGVPLYLRNIKYGSLT